MSSSERVVVEIGFDGGQIMGARLTDDAYAAAQRMLEKHRGALDRIAHALLEKETLDREELDTLLADVEPESRASETVGTVRAVAVD